MREKLNRNKKFPLPPADKTGVELDLLLSLGWNEKRIANVLGCTLKELRTKYRGELRSVDAARDRLNARMVTRLWMLVEDGNIAALRELQRIWANGDLVDTPRLKPVGKKQIAAIVARTAGEGSEWGDDLKPPTN